jgi:hypothetical protein
LIRLLLYRLPRSVFRVGVGVAEVAENIPAAAYEVHVIVGHFDISLPRRSRASIRSSSCFGVLIPVFDFFWLQGERHAERIAPERQRQFEHTRAKADERLGDRRLPALGDDGARIEQRSLALSRKSSKSRRVAFNQTIGRVFRICRMVTQLSPPPIKPEAVLPQGLPGLLAFAVGEASGPPREVAGFLICATSIVGALLNNKHYERFEFHLARSREFRRSLENRKISPAA